jgi:hypothetical protein
LAELNCKWAEAQIRKIESANGENFSGPNIDYFREILVKSDWTNGPNILPSPAFSQYVETLKKEAAHD